MRGFLLSMDAIAASAILLILGLFIAAFSFQLGNEELQAKQVYYTGKDLTNVMFTATVKDLEDLPLIRQHFNNGSLTSADLNRTLLEVAGYWWSTGNTTKATNLVTQTMNRILNGTVYGYQITLDDVIIFFRPKLGAKQISQSSYIISGFGLGQQPEGVVASAYAAKIDANNVLSLDIGPEGSGVDSGQGAIIKKQFYLNSSDMKLFTGGQPQGRIYLSVQHGPNNVRVDAVKFNGIVIPMVPLYEADKGTGKLYFGSGNLTPFMLLNSWNELVMSFDGHTLGDSRTRPGSRVEIDYRQNITDFSGTTIEDDILYLDDIYSNGSAGKESGSWTIVPFFIPPGAIVTNATLFIHGKEVNNVSNLQNFGSGVSSANVMIFLNNKQIDAFNPGKPLVPLFTEYDVYRYLNLSNANAIGGGGGGPGPGGGGVTPVQLQTGTNVLSIYINCYNTTFWGRLNTQLYSSPMNDSKNSSFLRITYIKPANENKFGYITVGARKNVGGNPSDPNNLTFFINNTKIIRSFLHISQLDSGNVTITINHTGMNTTVFTTPRPYATPTTIYAPESAFNISTFNSIYFSDKCNDMCLFLPTTSLEYYPQVPSLVGYGALFPNESAATIDAVERLEGVMGSFATATSVINISENVPGIQTLWGPVHLDVRIWS